MQTGRMKASLLRMSKERWEELSDGRLVIWLLWAKKPKKRKEDRGLGACEGDNSMHCQNHTVQLMCSQTHSSAVRCCDSSKPINHRRVKGHWCADIWWKNLMLSSMFYFFPSLHLFTFSLPLPLFLILSLILSTPFKICSSQVNQCKFYKLMSWSVFLKGIANPPNHPLFLLQNKQKASQGIVHECLSKWCTALFNST